MKILSEMYLLTRKSPLSFASHLDPDRTALVEVCALRVLVLNQIFAAHCNDTSSFTPIAGRNAIIRSIRWVKRTLTKRRCDRRRVWWVIDNRYEWESPLVTKNCFTALRRRCRAKCALCINTRYSALINDCFYDSHPQPGTAAPYEIFTRPTLYSIQLSVNINSSFNCILLCTE